jgi:hypothetical protein
MTLYGVGMKRAFWHKLIPVFFILAVACPAYCNIYYLAPDGDDTAGDGSKDNPWFTIPKAVTAMSAGDTTYLRGGRYIYTVRVSISKVGTSSAMYRLFAYPDDTNRPILDFNALAYNSSNRGITLSGSYWYMKGFDVYRAGDNGMIIQGTYNTVEFCSFYENHDSGLQLSNGAAYNRVINCDSYYNFDDPCGGNADGFSPKLTVGTGNYFYGCRSWQNSDDGYDGYLDTSDDVNTTYENCWAFKNGYLKDANSPVHGNGNGFKMGGSTNHDKRHNVIYINCFCFNNYAKGFDQNHDVGSITILNGTAYSNGSNNYNIPDALASGKTARVINCINFTGSISLGAFVVRLTDSWLSPFVTNSADFVNLNPSAAYGSRKADGSLPDINFMHLVAGSDLINGGSEVNDINVWHHGSAPDLGCFEWGGCYSHFGSDLYPDCQVDLMDYADMANAWEYQLTDADLNRDGSIDLSDLAQFAAQWLMCNRDPQSECWQP